MPYIVTTKRPSPERYFDRFSLPIRAGGVIALADGAHVLIDTVHVADDLRGAKCTFYKLDTVAQRAVATLDEAREHAADEIAKRTTPTGRLDAGAPCPADARVLPGSGGTITLPDGTTIEVERVGWNDLRAALGHKPKAHEPRSPLYTAIILAAFNAREADR